MKDEMDKPRMAELDLLCRDLWDQLVGKHHCDKADLTVLVRALSANLLSGETVNLQDIWLRDFVTVVKEVLRGHDRRPPPTDSSERVIH